MPTSYNYKPLANFPKAAIHYEISNNAAAHLATGLAEKFGIEHSKEIFQLKVMELKIKKIKKGLFTKLVTIWKVNQ